MPKASKDTDGPYCHGHKLKYKCVTCPELEPVSEVYDRFAVDISGLRIIDETSVREYVRRFNNYRDAVAYTLERRANSGQELLRSSMLEEFCYHLFKDLVNDVLKGSTRNVVLGSANTYVDLSFIPESFVKLLSEPTFYIHTKDQDFVIGADVKIGVAVDGPWNSTDAVIPVVAIECKTYIESNMLDSCAGTARRLKSGMPYCRYIVVAEYMKMDEARPELTDIDEIFILCRATVSERSQRFIANDPIHPIDPDVVVALFNLVAGHLKSIWWDPANALKTGRVIGRP